MAPAVISAGRARVRPPGRPGPGPVDQQTLKRSSAGSGQVTGTKSIKGTNKLTSSARLVSRCPLVSVSVRVVFRNGLPFPTTATPQLLPLQARSRLMFVVVGSE